MTTPRTPAAPPHRPLDLSRLVPASSGNPSRGRAAWLLGPGRPRTRRGLDIGSGIVSPVPPGAGRAAARARTGLALLAAAAVLAACAGTPSEPRTGEDGRTPSGPSPDQFLAAGDYDRAVYQYERIARDRSDDPEIREKLRTARRLAAQRHAENAVAAAERDDFERAVWEMGQAERFDREALPVLEARRRIGPRLDGRRDAAAVKTSARAMMGTDPAGAVEMLAEARKRSPTDPELTELLTTATRNAQADAAAARAEDAWTSGSRRRAVEHLAVASVGGIACPRAVAFRKRMENDLVAESAGAALPVLREDFALAREAGLSPAASDAIRDRLADALLREARRHEDAGRPATAALFEVEAERAGAKVDARNADRVRGEHAIVLHVVPFEDGTGGSVDGLRLARAVRDRVVLQSAGGTAALRAVLESAAAAAPPAFPHLAVTGRALSQRVTSGRVGRETQTVKYVTGSRDAANPALAKLTTELDAVRGRLARARESVAAAETNLRNLKALGFARGGGGTIPSEGDIAYQTRLADAETQAENARRAARGVEREEFEVRQRIVATPGTVAEQMWAERAVEVTTLVKTAEVVAQVQVTDGGTTLLDEKVTGSDLHRETVAPGWEPGGIAADPDETPDDAAMAARAADQLAGAVSGKIRDAAERAARRLLEDARAAERRGDAAAAAESYALFLFATSETATPERADAARALTEILGAPPALRTGFVPEVRR